MLQKSVIDQSQVIIANITRQLSTGELLFPVIPGQVNLVQEAIQCGQSIIEIESILSRDPALALTALKTANTAAFSAGRVPCHTIGNAIRRLGTERLGLLVTAAGLKSMFTDRVSPLCKKDMRKFWIMSLQMAGLSSFFAGRKQDASVLMPERVYTKALTYFTGAIPIITHFAQEQQKGNYHSPKIQAMVMEGIANKISQHITQRWGLGEEYVGDLKYLDKPQLHNQLLQERHCLLAARCFVEQGSLHEQEQAFFISLGLMTESDIAEKNQTIESIRDSVKSSLE